MLHFPQYFQKYSKLNWNFSFISMLSKNWKWCHDLKIAYGGLSYVCSCIKEVQYHGNKLQLITIILLPLSCLPFTPLLGAQWLSAWRETEGSRVRASPAWPHCGPWARHIYPSLVLVQPRKTRPCLTETILMERKESNQTNKQNSTLCQQSRYKVWSC